MTINLLGNDYPIKVSKNEVKVLQSIEKELNQKLQNFINKFEGVDREKALSMVLISYAFDLKQTIQNFDEDEIKQRLENVEKTLTSAIHSLS